MEDLYRRSKEYAAAWWDRRSTRVKGILAYTAIGAGLLLGATLYEQGKEAFPSSHELPQTNGWYGSSIDDVAADPDSLAE